jgi:hypothetical protein
MLEKLSDNRVFLYRHSRVENGLEGEIRWKLLRKLVNFPDEFMGGSYYLSLVSPDFTRYIELDTKSRKFRIMNLID